MPGKLRSFIAAAAVVFGVAGCAGTGNVNTSVSGSGGFQFAVSTGEVDVFAAGDRAMAHDVTGTTLQGQRLSLSTYRGKYLVINFWSESCAPCRGEEPGFAALAKADAAKGVEFVGIDQEDNRAAALGFEQHFRVPYPSLYDRTNSYLLDFPGAVPTTTPFTIVLDPQGRIAAKAAASLDLTTLTELVNHVRADST